MSTQKPFLYNPAEKSKQQLLAEFVIRGQEFETIFDILKSANYTIAPQHFLIVGQRGMGKTTLMLRIKYALEDDIELSKNVVPVRFSEEQYNIARLDRLWEETAQILEHNNESYAGLYEEILEHEKQKDYEQVAFVLLEKRLKHNKQRAVLFIDNIGELLEKFGKNENHRFRQILQTSTAIQIIGGSSRVLEHTFSYKEPFYDFFKEVKLKPIGKEQAVELLRALGTAYNQLDEINEVIEKNPQRIETLRRLTGGVPRTIALLFEIFADQTNGTAFDDLQHLLDNVNSLYKHRVDELKPQQQQIIDALARAWDPIDSAQILEQSRLYREGVKSNQISSQLKQLADNQLIEETATEGRKKFYAIRERFFNIWYLMRHGRKHNREDILWLVKFLECWCTVNDLHTMATKQLQCMQEGTYSPKAAYLKAKAFASLAMDYETKNKYLAESKEYLSKAGYREWADEITSAQKEVEENTWLRKAMKAIENEELIKAEEYLLKSIELNEPKAIHEAGVFYAAFFNNTDKAEKYFLQAVEKGYNKALFNLGLLYDESGDKGRAEKYYLLAIENGDASAMFNLGLLYYYNGDKDKAEKYYLLAIENGHAGAMNNLGFLYDKNGEMENAEQYYLLAIEKGEASAMYNLGLLYSDKGDKGKAEKYYLQAVEKGNIDAMNNLGLLYIKKDDKENAKKYYLQAVENGNVSAMFNLGLLYNECNDNQKAQEYFTMAAGIGHPQAIAALILLFPLNDIKQAMRWAEVLFIMRDFMENSLDIAIDILNLFLEKGQYHFLLQQFKKEGSLLMKYAKPFYYAVAYFLKDELSGEYERAGAEIKETVDEIIEKVKAAQAEDAQSSIT